MKFPLNQGISCLGNYWAIGPVGPLSGPAVRQNSRLLA